MPQLENNGSVWSQTIIPTELSQELILNTADTYVDKNISLKIAGVPKGSSLDEIMTISNLSVKDDNNELLLALLEDEDEDTFNITIGTFYNAGAGWNDFTFPYPLKSTPKIFIQLEDSNGSIAIKNITNTGFSYCIYIPNSSSKSITDAVITTAESIAAQYLAIEQE